MYELMYHRKSDGKPEGFLYEMDEAPVWSGLTRFPTDIFRDRPDLAMTDDGDRYYIQDRCLVAQLTTRRQKDFS
jgi:hypothetical protein